jgi:hypothetical protein
VAESKLSEPLEAVIAQPVTRPSVPTEILKPTPPCSPARIAAEG